MQVTQITWDQENGWATVSGAKDIAPNLILYFGTRSVISDGMQYNDLKKLYPDCIILGASSGGEILNDEVRDNSIAAVLLRFEKTTLKTTSHQIKNSADSCDIGEKIGNDLNDPSLSAIFVISDGLNINGSALVSGIKSVTSDVTITGGLASDGEHFKETLVGLNCPPVANTIAAVGFYGDAIRVGHGSMGGWVPFGPEREITKSDGNVLLELCDKPALALYKKYLGDDAGNLPGNALLYPLAIKSSMDANDAVVRTVLSIDEENQTMTFAGDVPERSIAQLMYGNFDNLIEGAEKSAELATANGQDSQQVGIVISCVGRRLLMGQNINDELEAVYHYWKKNVPITGFYSYGEISPHAETGICGLHNQTMTITTFGEV